MNSKPSQSPVTLTESKETHVSREHVRFWGKGRDFHEVSVNIGELKKKKQTTQIFPD